MLTEKELKAFELNTPHYDFVEVEGEDKVSPIKRTVAKMQETATTFTLYEVYQSIGQLDKLIKDKEAEIKQHKDMKKLFEAELKLVEKDLNVKDLEKQYKNECLAEAAVAELAKKNDNNTAN